jgi:hypothetical protein
MKSVVATKRLDAHAVISASLLASPTVVLIDHALARHRAGAGQDRLSNVVLR